VNNDQEESPRASIENLLRDVLDWTQGDGEYGPYCKLCNGEGVDVEHEDNCPVPDIRRPSVRRIRIKASWPVFCGVVSNGVEEKTQSDCTVSCATESVSFMKGDVRLERRRMYSV
jgi:hypothetical protein